MLRNNWANSFCPFPFPFHVILFLGFCKVLISFEGLSKSYGASLILDSMTAKIEDADRIGLIGINGAGKSTLLNLLIGELEPDEGVLSRSAAAIGFLRQNSGLSSTGTIQSEMLRVFADLLEMERRIHALEKHIAATDPAADAYAALTAEYAALQGVFEQREGYHIQVRIDTVLNGMGFAGVDREMPVEVLSGGEKTRLALCKLLLEQPALLMLDEPTNHLDFKTLLWLEEYLQGYKGALLVVSHDRYFLDKLCTSVWEVERHRLEVYPGNYSKYVLLKEERLDRQRKEYEIQQAEIADLKDFVARNIVRATTSSRAKSKQKALDRMDLVERPKPPPKPARLRFSYRREPVKDVLHVERLTLSVGEAEEHKTLCEGVDFDMLRGEKIALIGANGVGKSTFLKAIQGLHEPDKGEIEWGKNTDISYFEQEDFALHSDKTALDELWDRFPREYEHTIRTALGNVQLTGENVFKKVGELSGGERAKLKFAILLLSCGNVLLMDEPTNHLDLSTKEALDGALRDYTGTLLVISHDRYLLNKFPTKIAEMHPGGFRLYNGNYDRYIAQKAEQPAQPLMRETQSEKAGAGDGYYRSKQQRSEEAARKRRIEQLEKEIEQLEKDIFRLENEIAEPAVAADYAELQKRCDELETSRVDLDIRIAEWTELCE